MTLEVAGCAGTDQHKEWLRVEKAMFEAFRSITQKILGPNRLWKYKISLFEQQIILGRRPWGACVE